jgi:hypothetical protein
MKVQIVTPYRVSHLQRYGVTVRGNVTSVYPPLHTLLKFQFPQHSVPEVAPCYITFMFYLIKGGQPAFETSF